VEISSLYFFGYGGVGNPLFILFYPIGVVLIISGITTLLAYLGDRLLHDHIDQLLDAKKNDHAD
jgi:uncharacterized membrane protein HdeD (DUF308 family)